MIVAIIILCLFVLFMTVYIAACVVHIRRIQKELEEISKEQSTQNSDIRNIAIHLRDLTVAHNELVAAFNGEPKQPKIKNKNVNTTYFGPPGEA